MERKFLDNNEKIRTFEEIENSLFKKDPISFSRLRIFIDIMAGFIGMFFLFIAILININSNLKFALLNLALSFIFFNYYYIQNFLFEKNEGDFDLSDIWRKYKTLYTFILILLYFYFYYLLSQITDNYFIPFFVIFPMRYFIILFVTIKLSREYWMSIGISDIKKYAESNGLKSVL